MTSPSVVHRDEKKLLSVCLTGRNDQYGVHFARRLCNCIEYFARNAGAIGRLDAVEVVIVDWNSEVPLADTIRLSPGARRVSQFIVVPPAVAREMNYGGTGFHSIKALNAGIRRATGQFVMAMPADVLVPQHSLLQLLDLLEGRIPTCFDPGKVGMVISRRNIPPNFDDSGLGEDFSRLERYLTLADATLDRDVVIHSVMSGAGAILAHRNVFKEQQGVNEEMGGWGASDIEFGLRLNRRYPTVNLSFFGVCVYDYEPNAAMVGQKDRRANKFPHLALEVNDANWGLGDLELESRPAETHGGGERPGNDKQTGDQGPISLDDLSSDRAREFVSRSLHYKAADVQPYCLPLAWFALTRKCERYLEYGLQSSSASLCVSAVNPCAEMLLVVPFRVSQKRTHDIRLIKIAAGHLSSAKHRGYVQFVPGDPTTAFERACGAFHGRKSLDLVLFHTDTCVGDPVEEARVAFRHLAEGGGLVAAGSDGSVLKRIREMVEREFPGHESVLCERYGVCLFVDGPINGNRWDRGIEKRLCRAWRPLRRKDSLIGLAYFCFAVASLLAGLVFVPCHRWLAVVWQHVWRSWRFARSPEALATKGPVK